MNSEYKTLDEVMDAMTEDQQLLAIENQFPYMFTKAAIYLSVGPEQYSKEDYFKLPKTTDTEELEWIKQGCIQLCMGKGLFEGNPFTGLGVSGFYLLMELFHFKSVSRKTKRGIFIGGQRGVLDCITFEHIIDGRPASYYNFCVYSFDE